MVKKNLVKKNLVIKKFGHKKIWWKKILSYYYYYWANLARFFETLAMTYRFVINSLKLSVSSPSRNKRNRVPDNHKQRNAFQSGRAKFKRLTDHHVGPEHLSHVPQSPRLLWNRRLEQHALHEVQVPRSLLTANLQAWKNWKGKGLSHPLFVPVAIRGWQCFLSINAWYTLVPELPKSISDKDRSAYDWYWPSSWFRTFK